MNERDSQIRHFLNKFDEMLVAANKVDGFKWTFNVTISSDNSIKMDRVKTINGINEAFTNNNMSWSSDSTY